jgi:hypothetical protein
MDPIAIIEGAKKHGISVLLIFALVWMNNRLTDVEEKLYDCLEDRAQARQMPLSRKQQHELTYVAAVLPERLKVKWAR